LTLISVEGTDKNQLKPGHMEFCHQNRPVRWSIAMKEKPAVGSPFFGVYPSDRISKAT